MQQTNRNAEAGSSRLYRKPAKPFVSAKHKPEDYDGIYRVVLITSGSVASIKAPSIVGELCKSGNVAVQVVATKASSDFYTQSEVDEAVRDALGTQTDGSGNTGRDGDGSGEVGVPVWTDEDEWGNWKKPGDPILHIELRRWADLVVVAPCSANILAKIAGGLCDNLGTSLLRALSPSTPVILFPAMNTHMYQHRFTAKHLRIVQEELEYFVMGPQGAGTLACGDEGPGKMTDWREIVVMIQHFATIHHLSITQAPGGPGGPGGSGSTSSAPSASVTLPSPPTPTSDPASTAGLGRQWQPKLGPQHVKVNPVSPEEWGKAAQNGDLWAKKFWMG